MVSIVTGKTPAARPGMLHSSRHGKKHPHQCLERRGRTMGLEGREARRRRLGPSPSLPPYSKPQSLGGLVWGSAP